MKNKEISNKLINFRIVSFVSLVLFLVSTTAWGVSAYTKLDNRCEQQCIKINEALEEQVDLEKNVQDNKLNYIEIRTKLDNIEAMLMELKANLRTN